MERTSNRGQQLITFENDLRTWLFFFAWDFCELWHGWVGEGGLCLCVCMFIFELCMHLGRLVFVLSVTAAGLILVVYNLVRVYV